LISLVSRAGIEPATY